MLEFAELHFEVAAATGGRVVSVQLNHNELLSGADVNATNYGSTFWTSPQSDWNWPPIAAIDSAAFALSADATSCTLVGPQVADSGHPNVDAVSITKQFSADLAQQSVIARYTITNHGATAKRLAPWEITRVAPGGLTLYASDSAPLGSKQPPTTMAAGCIWFQHAPSVPADSKLLGDAKGWVAHVSADNLLLVKAFTDSPASAAAPGEGEVEVYSSPSYVEVEDQGAYDEIPAGGALSWEVRWYVRALPSTLSPAAGNAKLVTYVSELLK